jgi:hypothetical protein
MESNKPSTQTPTTHSDRQPVVYVMPPQQTHGDEIDLWQLFLPLLKYKVQIILFLLMGALVGIALQLFLGNTIYTNTVAYQFDKNRFEKRKELSIPEEFVAFSKSEEILSIPNKYRSIIIGRFADNTIVFTGVTNDPQITNEALVHFHSFFKERNKITIMNTFDLKIGELKRAKNIIDRDFISLNQSEEKITYAKIGNKTLLFHQNKGIYYVLETRHVGEKTIISATKYSKSNISRIFEHQMAFLISHLQKKQTITNELMFSLLGFQQMSKQMLQLKIEQKTNNEIIYLLEEKKSFAKNDNLEKKSMELAEKTGVLQAKINQHKLEITDIEELSSRITYFIMQLKDLPIGLTIEKILNDRSNDPLNAKQDPWEYLRNSKEYFTQTEKTDEEIQKFSITKHLINEDYVRPIITITPPSLELTQRNFKLNLSKMNIVFDPDAAEVTETKMGSVDLSPIYYSKKVFIICLGIALFIAIVSVYARILISRIKKNGGFQEQKKEFTDALRFWKL